MAEKMNYEALQANLERFGKASKMAFENAKEKGEVTSEQETVFALVSNEAFMEKFFATENAEQAQKLFCENGIELSLEETKAFGACVAGTVEMLIENGGELPEEALESVAGGVLTEASVVMAVVETVSTTSLFSSSIGSAAAAGAAAGSGFPVVGTIIGAAAAAAVATGVIYRKEIASGVSKAIDWVKSWF